MSYVLCLEKWNPRIQCVLNGFLELACVLNGFLELAAKEDAVDTIKTIHREVQHRSAFDETATRLVDGLEAWKSKDCATPSRRPRRL